MDETGADSSPGTEPLDMEPNHPRPRRAGMGLAGVLAFAVLVAGVSVLASRNGGSTRLPMLPAAGTGGAAGATGAPGPDVALAPAGPVSYRLQGTLPSLPDHAPAFRLSTPDLNAVSRLAAALGLTNAPQRTANQWLVQEGTRLLMVGVDPAANWVYTADAHCAPVQSAQMGVACAAVPPVGFGVASLGASGSASSGSGSASGGTGSASSGTGSASSGTVAPNRGMPGQATTGSSTTIVLMPGRPAPNQVTCGGPVSCAATVTVPCAFVENSKGAPPAPCPTITVPPRPADAPTVTQATSVARDLLGRLGVDTVHAAVTTAETLNGWQVELAPEVSGLPTSGFEWNVDVGRKGAIEGAGGRLGKPALLGSYPLIGVQAAFDRLKSGNGGPGGIVPMMGAPAIACPEPVPPAPPAPAPATTSNATLPSLPYCRQQVVTITGARLGLRLAVSATEAVLEPEYLFQVAPQGEVPVVATVDRLVAGSPPVARVLPAPAPVPAKPVPLPVPAPSPGTSPGVGAGQPAP